MFCSNQKGVAYKIFNKQLTENQYHDIVNKINIDFSEVAWINHKEVMEAHKNNKGTCHGKNLKQINDYDTRKEAWRPVKDQLIKLRELEIWDSEANKVVEEITGWNLDDEAVANVEEMTMEEICKELGRNIKIKK